MDGLLLRLRGPLQSWGAATAGDTRPTMDVPTQSGVLGLVAACLGIDRHEVAPLRKLHELYAVSVRVDAPGTRLIDFHTVDRPESKVATEREYLQDACFTAIMAAKLSGEPTLEEIEAALKEPRFLPYLGRRSCPLSEPLFVARVRAVDARAMLLDRASFHDQLPRPEAWHLWLDGRHRDVSGFQRDVKVRDVYLGPRVYGERWVTHAIEAANVAI